MQVANKRVTKFTTKIFNILISFDMRTLKKSQVSLIKTWTMEGSYGLTRNFLGVTICSFL